MKIIKLLIGLNLLFIHLIAFGQYPNYKTIRKDLLTVAPAGTPNDAKVSSIDLNNDGSIDIILPISNQSVVEVFLQNPDGSFIKTTYPVISSPTQCLVTDFNSDNRLDILVINNSSNNLNLLIGDGTGSFINSNITTGITSDGLAVTDDFDNDGKFDVIISSGIYFFLKGNGNGTFQTATTIYTGIRPFNQYNSENLAVGDFNKDGNKDLAVVVNYTNFAFNILLGNGNGSFGNYANYEPSNPPAFIKVIDYNKDGIEDILYSGPKLCLGKGDGTFNTAIDLSTKSTVSTNAFAGDAFRISDLNNDGIFDFVIYYNYGINSENSKLIVIKGNSDGTFTPISKIPGGDFIMDVDVKDADSDGKKDLVIANKNSNFISILKGNGDFTFGNDYSLSLVTNTSSYFQNSITAAGMAFLDKNSDSKMDVIAASDNNNFAFYAGNGDVTFQAPKSILTTSQSTTIENADFNNDGIDDLLYHTYKQKNYSVSLTNPDGSSASAITTSLNTLSYIYEIKINDINNDGNKDLIMLNYNELKFEIHLGNGDGTFVYNNNFNSLESYDFDMADIDKDSKLDLISASCSTNTVLLYKGNGLGQFGSPTSYNISTFCAHIMVKDLNKDDYPDLVIANTSYNNIHIHMNNLAGGFITKGKSYSSGSRPSQLIAEDFNNDGNMDVVSLNTYSNDLSFYAGMGDGSFLPEKKYSVHVYPYLMKSVDINGDGFKDIAVANIMSNDISFLISNGQNFWLTSDVSDNVNYNTTYGNTIPVFSYKIYDKNISGNISINPGNGYEVSTDSLNFFPTLTLTPTNGTTVAPRKIFLRSASPLINAGMYSALITHSSPEKTFNLKFTSTINKASIRATVDYYTKTYGSPNPSMPISYSGFVYGENSSVIDQLPIITTLAKTNSSVGIYPITASRGYDNNYDFIYWNGKIEIVKANLNVKAISSSKVYGDPNPPLKYKISGFVLNEDSTVLTKLPDLSTTAQTSSSVGNYPITATGATANNYTFTYQNAFLTINKANLIVKAMNTTKTYGDPNPSFGYTISGFVLNEDSTVLSNLPTILTTATTVSPVGNYPITVSGATANNYNSNYQDGTLAITKAHLNFTALNASITYGDPIPSLDYKISGFVLNEDSTVLDQLPSITTTADLFSSSGIYSIVLSGGTDGNYDYSFENSILTIDKAMLTIQVKDTTRLEGSTNPDFTILYSGFVGKDNEASISGTPLINVDADINSLAGTYSISILQGSLTSQNYDFNFINGTLTIKKVSGITNGNTNNYSPEFNIISSPFSHEVIIEEIADEANEIQVYDLNGRNEMFTNSHFKTCLKGTLVIEIKGNKSIQKFKILKY